MSYRLVISNDSRCVASHAAVAQAAVSTAVTLSGTSWACTAGAARIRSREMDIFALDLIILKQ